MTTTTSNNNNTVSQFRDTTLTKVFVGGLAWETPREALRDHFQKYGEILEAVIISDKATGRSKGYGFVTFKEADAAKKACEDPTPVINGRRANCNLASLGARRPKSSANSPPRYQDGGPRNVATATAAANHVQWYYPVGTAAPPFHHHQHHHPLPIYGYPPAYIATDINYNQKLSYNGSGAYMNGQHFYHQTQPSHAIVGGNALMPMYPLYHFHQTQIMGVPAHMYQPITAGHFATVPALISKPHPGTGTVGGVECMKKVA